MKYRLFQARSDASHGLTEPIRVPRKRVSTALMPLLLCGIAVLAAASFLEAKPAEAKSVSAGKRKAAAKTSVAADSTAAKTESAASAADSTAAKTDSIAAADSAKAPAKPADAAADPIKAAAAAPASVVMDYIAMDRRAQDIHPMLLEKKLEIDKAEQQMRELEMAAILPRFQVETGIGPAPGLKTLAETTLVSSSVAGGASGFFEQYHKDYDFGTWGPFFGIEVTVAQPLNLSRYRAGHKATVSNVKVAQAQFHKEQLDVSEDAQKLYFQRVYAGQMFAILKDATKELDRAQKKMEEMLDEGDQGVKQTDLLELKAGRYTLEKARNEAGLGVARADLGLRFLLQLPDSIAIVPKDSVLALRGEALPSLDSLKLLTLLNHPDLKRLANGLAARRELVRVAKGEIGPDIFLFGTFKYTKAWSTDRQSGGEDPFARDPLNEITGVGGLGMRLNLNFWSRYQKARKEKIELTQLERTETYAARGLILKMQDEYVQMLNQRANVTEAQKSLRAAEAWLKGAALKYDLEPSTAKDMIGPYKTVLGAKRDYFEAVMNYNLAVAKVIKSIGWTLADYLHSLSSNQPAAP
jgi:outer membrane protein TolC